MLLMRRENKLCFRNFSIIYIEFAFESWKRIHPKKGSKFQALEDGNKKLKMKFLAKALKGETTERQANN